MGYGLLISVLQRERGDFDGFLRFWRRFLTPKGLMYWQLLRSTGGEVRLAPVHSDELLAAATGSWLSCYHCDSSAIREGFAPAYSDGGADFHPILTAHCAARCPTTAVVCNTSFVEEQAASCHLSKHF